ncbi:MAG: hypothetical protein MZW92_81050 [Comamonadaceae bacterium]|nr:hypothetical protein [Comamonadaceae bacterium]
MRLRRLIEPTTRRRAAAAAWCSLLDAGRPTAIGHRHGAAASWLLARARTRPHTDGGIGRPASPAQDFEPPPAVAVVGGPQ